MSRRFSAPNIDPGPPPTPLARQQGCPTSDQKTGVKSTKPPTEHTAHSLYEPEGATDRLNEWDENEMESGASGTRYCVLARPSQQN